MITENRSEIVKLAGLLNSNNIRNNSDSRNEHQLTEGIQEHLDIYSEILDLYVQDTACNFLVKRRYKKILFWLCFFVMVIVTGLLIFVMITPHTQNDYIASYAAAVIPFVSAFIVIPQIITQYLFDTNEKKMFVQLISTLSNHDQSMYKYNMEKVINEANADQKEDKTKKIPNSPKRENRDARRNNP